MTAAFQAYAADLRAVTQQRDHARVVAVCLEADTARLQAHIDKAATHLRAMPCQCVKGAALVLCDRCVVLGLLGEQP